MEEKQKVGQEAIALARKALEIHTQLSENEKVANDMNILADALDYFNDNDDEVLRLYENAKEIYVRMQGSSSANVAAVEANMGDAYGRRARRGHDANDLDCELKNLELALPRFIEAARIYRTIGRIDDANRDTRNGVRIEERIKHLANATAAARG